MGQLQLLRERRRHGLVRGEVRREGAFQWVRQFGTATDDYATGIAATRLASHDVVFVSGYSLGRFDGSAPQGNYDVVVAKFDTGGNPYWLRQFGSARSDVALGVAVSPNEDVYVTGYTYGSFDGVTNPGNTVDLFLAKYSVLGEPQWIRQLGSSHDEFGTGVAVADDGGVYVSGYTSGALEGSTRLGSYDAVLVKYDTQGNWHWTRQIGTATTDYAQSVAVGKEGRVYLAGFTSGAMGGEPLLGSTDMFLATYDSHGTWLDFRQVGSTSADRGQGVATAEDGAVYLVGYTLGQTSSFPSAGATTRCCTASWMAPRCRMSQGHGGPEGTPRASEPPSSTGHRRAGTSATARGRATLPP